jgi:type I restriction enzyme S subunit
MGDIPWATVKDFKRFRIADTEEHITQKAITDSATNLVDPGTVLLVSRVGLGKVAIAGCRLAINQDIKALTPKSSVLPDYLFWFLLAKAPDIERMGAGATVKGITLNDIKAIQIPVPPLPEQRRIVDLLSRAEGIVRLRREAEKKAAELIPALFLDMFGDPATNPKGWPVAKVGALLVEPPTLGTMAKPSSTDGKWLDLRVANIQGGQLTLDDRKWLDLPDAQVQRFALRRGDVVLARAIGSLDHLGKAVVLNPDGDWVFDSHLMRLRFDQSRLLPEVFKGFLESSTGREAFLKHTRRSAVQFNINGKEIRQIEIPVPPLAIQQEYCARVEEVCSIHSQQSMATAKAQAAFDALLASVFNDRGGN